MALRRMFSQKIVASDAFLEMPTSSRELYFQLGMYADDDGFVSPKKIIRMVGASDDDIKVLLSKRFVIGFENGVIVIKHWKINNLIRKDFYQETMYLEQKKTLKTKDNKAYTECEQIVNKMLPQYRLGKVRKEKKYIATETVAEETKFNPLGAEIIKAFEEINPATKRMYGNKTQRKACDDLISEYGLERTLKVVAFVAKVRGQPFYPTITTPHHLFQKWSALEQAAVRRKNEKNIKHPVAFV